MEIIDIVDMLPEAIAREITEFKDVELRDGRQAVRVTIGRVLTFDETKSLKGKHFVGVGCIATYRYAPEIKASYFYVV